MKKIILLVLVSFLTLPVTKHAYAVKWVPEFVTERALIYVDAESVQKNGNLVQMWTLTDYNSSLQLPSGSLYLSILDFYTFNCLSRLYSSGKQIHYPEKMGMGNAVRTNNTVDPFESPIPGTVTEGLYKFACMKNK
jgi:hypothetical protein